MITATPLIDIEHLRSKWGWFLAFGIILIALGMIALTFIPAATLGSVIVLGWLMILSGFVEAVEAVRARRWQGVFLHIIGSLLGVLVGLLIVDCCEPYRRRAGLDLALCCLLYGARSVSHHYCALSEVPKLGLGRL